MDEALIGPTGLYACGDCGGVHMIGQECVHHEVKRLRAELATASAAGFAAGVEAMREAVCIRVLARTKNNTQWDVFEFSSGRTIERAIRALPAPREGGE